MSRPPAKNKRAKLRRPDSQREQQLELLARLKDLAAATGLDVREERLMREAGYSVHSGLCRVNGRELLILDRNLAPRDRIEVTVGILAHRDLDSIYIEPAMRDFLDGGSPPPAATSKTERSKVDGGTQSGEFADDG